MKEITMRLPTITTKSGYCLAITPSLSDGYKTALFSVTSDNFRFSIYLNLEQMWIFDAALQRIITAITDKATPRKIRNVDYGDAHAYGTVSISLFDERITLETRTVIPDIMSTAHEIELTTGELEEFSNDVKNVREFMDNQAEEN
ncbi:hypothetical protein ACX3U9_09710 [Corynebacterium pyruviciproducens]